MHGINLGWLRFTNAAFCCCTIWMAWGLAVSAHAAAPATQPAGPDSVKITAVNGSVASDQLLTISGSGFGEKSKAAPVKFEDFESGETGKDLQGWVRVYGEAAKYTDQKSLGGKLSSHMSFRKNSGSGGVLKDLNLTTAYVSYWVYWERISGVPSRNIKFGRLASGSDSDPIHGDPQVGFTMQRDKHGTWYTTAAKGIGQTIWADIIPGNGWQRVEMYVKISDPNTANGARGIWLNGKAILPLDKAYQSLTDTSDSKVYRHFSLPMYVAHDEGGEYDIYVDNVHIDNTLARVEIGNAAKWADCTRRQIQTLNSWKADAIEFRANLDGMGDKPLDQPLYLYVVDAEGNVNSAGHLLQPAAGQGMKGQ